MLLEFYTSIMYEYVKFDLYIHVSLHLYIYSIRKKRPLQNVSYKFPALSAKLCTVKLHV